MLNYVYQLVSPKNIMIKYEDLKVGNQVIIQPEYLALCHADQRYYQGKRDAKVLRQKLPMALIHEGCGRVLRDSTGTFQCGDRVVMIPNVPGDVKEDVIYENYRKGGRFLSSGTDGFMREMVSLPADRVVKYDKIDKRIAAIAEFVSVGVHAVRRFGKSAHCYKGRIGIWGDGSLAYVVACVLKRRYPESCIVVIGKNINKLQQFSFVDEVHLVDDIDNTFEVDHAFECAGGEGSFYAIDDIIRTINPQGSVMLMGVSENKVPINTRNILEKGLSFIGCSRSGRADFEEAVEYMQEERFQRRLKTIVYETQPVRRIADIHRVFNEDMNTDFKTVFKWEI